MEVKHNLVDDFASRKCCLRQKVARKNGRVANKNTWAKWIPLHNNTRQKMIDRLLDSMDEEYEIQI